MTGTSPESPGCEKSVFGRPIESFRSTISGT